MMIMRTSLWTPSHPSSFGHLFLLVRLLKMGIVKMVDYTRGSHNVYKERYSDPALWQKEFDADIRFWLKFNAD
jgi:hypothetical protein